MQDQSRNSPTQPTPGDPDKTQKVQPSRPDVEVNPGKIGNKTEVDLDTTKTKTYPDKKTTEKN